jgi:hypothetical protein
MRNFNEEHISTCKSVLVAASNLARFTKKEFGMLGFIESSDMQVELSISV